MNDLMEVAVSQHPSHLEGTLLRKGPGDAEMWLEPKVTALNGKPVRVRDESPDGEWAQITTEGHESRPGWLRTRYLTYEQWPSLPTAQPAMKSCALLLTGSLSPVHLGHVHTLQLAKEKMEQEGYHVAAAYLSPSGDKYVKPKLNQSKHGEGAFQTSAVRASIARVTVREESMSWISVSTWEMQQVTGKLSGCPDFPEVVNALRKELDHAGNTECHVFFVSGSDHANKTLKGSYKAFAERTGWVIVARDGLSFTSKVSGFPLFVSSADHPAPGTQQVASKASSTKVREALRTGNLDAAEAMLGARLLAAIQARRLWGASPPPQAAPHACNGGSSPQVKSSSQVAGNKHTLPAMGQGTPDQKKVKTDASKGLGLAEKSSLSGVVFDFDNTITIGAFGDDPYTQPGDVDAMRLLGGAARIDKLTALFGALRSQGLELYIVSVGIKEYIVR